MCGTGTGHPLQPRLEDELVHVWVADEGRSRRLLDRPGVFPCLGLVRERPQGPDLVVPLRDVRVQVDGVLVRSTSLWSSLLRSVFRYAP
jgi:hypothetical protein